MDSPWHVASLDNRHARAHAGRFERCGKTARPCSNHDDVCVVSDVDTAGRKLD
jgi:hypothetical protein